jgi:hypothetical protein
VPFQTVTEVTQAVPEGNSAQTFRNAVILQELLSFYSVSAEEIMLGLEFRACAGALILLLMGCIRWESFDLPTASPALPPRLARPQTGHPLCWGTPLCGVILSTAGPAATRSVSPLAWVTVGLLRGGLE